MSDRTDGCIDAALQDLATADARAMVPSTVKAAVLRAWDVEQIAGSAGRLERNHRVHAWRNVAAWALVPTAVAVGAVLAMLTRDPAPARNLRFSSVRTEGPIHVPADQPVRSPSDETGVPQPARHFLTDTRREPIESGYVIVPEPFSDPTALYVVRVRMARAALAATLGMPMIDPDAEGLVDVEMLVGDDGITRSVRSATFVHENADQGAGR